MLPLPAAMAWNPSAAALYSQKTGGTVLIISRKGRPTVQVFAPGFHAGSTVPVFSITKSITALACLSRRELSVETPVRTTPSCPPITLRHLLSQTSGLSTGYEILYKKGVKDVRKSAASLPVVARPGAQFVYGPGHYESVGKVFPSGTSGEDSAGQAIGEFLRRLGIEPAGWRQDRRGQSYLSAGAQLTPDDLLRLGKFVLNEGRLPPFVTVIPKSRLAVAFAGSDANPAYGLGFWLNRPSGTASERDIEDAIRAHLTRDQWHATQLSNSAPRDLVCMAGSGGQRVYIIPSIGAVIVRLGRSSQFKDPAFLDKLFSSAGE